MRGPERPGWWSDRPALTRFVCDLISGELKQLRPGRPAPALPWAPAARLETDLGIDSLERLQLATALAEAIHLHSSGIDDNLLRFETVGEWLETAARGLAAFSTELTFRTSGSTGQPKWCVHQLADLEAEVELLAHVLGERSRIFSAVPSHHIYGFLFTILLPARLQGSFIDVRGHAPSRLAGLLQPGDLVIGHPDFWRAFVRAVPRTAADVTGVTSTAPCPGELASEVTSHGIARLVDVYGSSETAGIGWRDDPSAAYEVFAYWRRGASDVELVRMLPDGAERVVAAPDALMWEGERRVRPIGRHEGAVQVGGVNVFPQRIGAVLASHPGVAAAAVRLMRPDEGNRLKAFVVPRGTDADSQALRTELWTWIDTRLTPPERPKSIVIGAQLPTGDLGKHADWPIPDQESD